MKRFLIPLFISLNILAHSSISFAQANSPQQTELWLGGDVHFGQAKENPLKNISEKLGGTGIVNLEGPIHKESGFQYEDGKWTIVNPLNSGFFLKEANVKVVSVSNNHDEDVGVAGRIFTEKSLKDAGLLPIGGSNNPETMVKNGFRIVFATYDLSKGRPRNLTSGLAAAKKEGDILIVTFHVTGPPGYLPSKELKEASNIAIRSGADIVASHGSHAIGPVERRGESIIAWGLGNLAFNCECTKEKEGIILQVVIKREKDKAPQISACAIPIEAGLNGEAAQQATNSEEIIDLLEAIGSKGINRRQGKACF
ncbi:MAG: CapA family protein [Deltaproteobacteria bacterium]|nr:CapA family protein [Deltaproteobacteria bacterium]